MASASSLVKDNLGLILAHKLRQLRYTIAI